VYKVFEQSGEVFLYGGEVGRVSGDKFERMLPESVGESVQRHTKLITVTGKEGAPQPTGLPISLGRTVLGSPSKSVLPALKLVTDTPQFVSSTGRVISKQGFDEESGIYLTSDEWADFGDGSQYTRKDARRAYRRLREVLQDFNFAQDDDGNDTKDWSDAVVVSAMLTLIARTGFASAPMFCVDANVPGAGKGLLVRVINMIATGVPTATQAMAGRKELDARITAAFNSGHKVIALDNVRSALSSESLEMLLTESLITARVLGASRMATFVNNMTVFATGNGITPESRDMARRILQLRLYQAKRRETYAYPELEQHVASLQHSLFTDCLIILCAYANVNAQERVDPTSRNSYTAWTRVIAAPILWISGEDIWAAADSSEEPESDLGSLREEVVAAWRGACAEHSNKVDNADGTACTKDSASFATVRSWVEAAIRGGRGDDKATSWPQRITVGRMLVQLVSSHTRVDIGQENVITAAALKTLDGLATQDRVVRRRHVMGRGKRGWSFVQGE
jgi:hypothetical protein